MDDLGLTATAADGERQGDSIRRPLLAGAKIGRYVVLDLLGQGAMGQVYTGYDVHLDRKVAIKVIRAELVSTRAHERTLREAKALAQLSHPNVVQVYEVGEHGEQLFVAMEHVDGENLRQWLLEGERPWQETSARVIEAGRGLRAAHAIGLVHRDVKPDNILVGKDGRARIADFGLVRAIEPMNPEARDPETTPDPDPDPEGSAARRAASGSGLAWGTGLLTQEGRAIGTPAYMSPEQHLGGEVDHRSDQFSLCASLFEALYAARPFSGHDVKTIREQAIAGKVRPTPTDTGVPRWIDRAIRRGLAPAPDERWPSIDALLLALSHDPSRRWRWAGAVILGLGLLAGGVYALASHQAQLANRCAGAAKELAGVWDEPRRQALGEAFEGTDDPLATETIPRVDRLLTAYADLWKDRHRATCEAHLSGATSPLLLDLTMDCLRRRKGELAALVQVLLEGEAGTVENAVLAASNLPSISACQSAESLLSATPLPDDPEQARELESIRGELDRALALESAGRYEDGQRLLDRLTPRSEALAYAPLTAEVLHRRGSLAMWQADFTAATPLLHRAFVTGLATKADRVAVEALAKWIYSNGYGLGSTEEVLSWRSPALALVDRLEGASDLRALTLNNLSSVMTLSGQLGDSIELQLQALALLESNAKNDNPLTFIALSNLSEGYLDLRRCAESEQASAKAKQLAAKMVGEKHPIVREIALNHCALYACSGSYSEAMTCWERELVDSSNLHGELRPFATSVHLKGRGLLALDRGEHDRASDDLSRALALFDRGSEPQHLAYVADGLAWLAIAEDDLDRAGELLHQSLAIHERLDTPQDFRLDTVAGFAALDLGVGRTTEARARLEAALASVDAATSEQPWLFARARFTLARALAPSPEPGERRRALSLAKRAAESLKVGHFQDGLRGEIEAWIDDYDPERPPPAADAPLAPSGG